MNTNATATHLLTTALGFAGGILVELEPDPAPIVRWQIQYGENVRDVGVELDSIRLIDGTYSHGGQPHMEALVGDSWNKVDLPHQWQPDAVYAAWERLRRERPRGEVWLADYVVEAGGVR